MYFNPRPREEGDEFISADYKSRNPISIHALVKRATIIFGNSIHTCRNFNPRPREEGDYLLRHLRKSQIISIHALVKRATFSTSTFVINALDFNPRPREEGDLSVKASSQISNYFNPRPREEGDAIAHSQKLVQSYFNPRPREEGDRLNVALVILADISIHALVKRATLFRLA